MINPMKKLVTFFATFFFSVFFSQDVFLRKIVDINQNSKDKFLYALDSITSNSKFLGELEVIGSSSDNQIAFTKIYNKAKEIGANSYSIKKFENIDGSLQSLDTSHYKLNLYYTPSTDFVFNTKQVYIFGNANKPQKIRIDNTNLELNESSYITKELLSGQSIAISTRKFLGSTIHYTSEASKFPAYFQISGFKIQEGSPSNSGLIFKSSDIVKLDTSYGQFLSIIFQKSIPNN
jgi:hypothetical protein